MHCRTSLSQIKFYVYCRKSYIVKGLYSLYSKQHPLSLDPCIVEKTTKQSLEREWETHKRLGLLEDKYLDPKHLEWSTDSHGKEGERVQLHVDVVLSCWLSMWGPRAPRSCYLRKMTLVLHSVGPTPTHPLFTPPFHFQLWVRIWIFNRVIIVLAYLLSPTISPD